MKYSKFNHLFNEHKNNYLYNSLTNSFFSVSDDLLELLKKIEENPTHISFLPETEYNELQKAKVLVDNDEFEVNKLKIGFDKSRFSNDFLYLTIAPTLKCNFNCHYCFESTKEDSIMTNETEDAIVNYVKKIDGLKNLNVCWFGGEPLLETERIISISKKLIDLGLNYRAAIITNGYLLTKEKFYLIKDYKINQIQVTIDGLEETHNKRRPHHSRNDSFSVIIKNLTDLSEYLIDNDLKVSIAIRVNIDKRNYDEFPILYSFLKEKIKYPLIVHPGWVEYTKNREIKSFCMHKNDVFKFIKKYDNFIEVSKMLYPNNLIKYCSARNFWSVVIGPDGDCYKCWEDIGNQASKMGNISSLDFLFSKVQQDYLYLSNPYNNNDCKSCSIQPACQNCPKDFLINNGNDKCPDLKENLFDYLKEYKLIKEKKTNPTSAGVK